MLNHSHTFQLPLAHTHPHLNTVFSKILRIGAHISIRRSWQVSADKKPHCEESSFLFLTCVIIKSLKHLYSTWKALEGGRKDTSVFPEGILSVVSPHSLSCPPPCFFIFDLLRQDFKEGWHHWLWKNILCYASHLFMIKCFPATHAPQEWKWPKNSGWIELFSEKESVLVSLLFFFLSWVFCLQTQCNENGPLRARKADKELWGCVGVFPHVHWGEKISSTNALFYLHLYVNLSGLVNLTC